MAVFLVNLKEIEDYDNATKFNHDIKKFESDLYQNLELWDTLMKVSKGQLVYKNLTGKISKS
jgi:hypothetical protein